jgi:hypothetical protein
METPKVALQYKKYDSDSIVGPTESPNNGKMYFTALFVEKSSENDGYSGQSKAHSKTFFEDTHALQFARCQKCLDNNTQLKVIGAYVHAECDAYYILRNGKQVGRDDSKPVSASNPARIGRKFTFFLMQDEDFESAYRNALKRLVKTNALVEVTEENPEEEQAKVENLNHKHSKK